MSKKEINRIGILEKRKSKIIRQREAALLAGISTRQIRRLEKKYSDKGVAGLVHGSRGKPSPRRLDEKIKKMIVKLAEGRYKGFGPTLVAEMVYEEKGIKVSSQTVRRYMIEEGLWERQRKYKKSYMRRTPKDYYGEMHQLDGSTHDWFEGRGPQATLLKFIDDATSEVVWAEFAPSESLKSVMIAARHSFVKNGLPLTLYTDRGTVFKVNSKEEHVFTTQFEQMMKNLDIKLIHARSPQAKGRVERSFNTDQDRLVKMLRLYNVSSIQEANKFLIQYYLPKHNAKFARKAKQKGDLHRSLKGLNLNDILATKVERIIRNDWTIQYNKRIFQLSSKNFRIVPKDKVIVHLRIDESIFIKSKNTIVPFQEIKSRLLPKPFVPDRLPQKHAWNGGH